MSTLVFLGALFTLQASALQLEDLEFEDVSIESFQEGSATIGWIKYSWCDEGHNPMQYNTMYTMDELVEIAQYAVTVKILPDADTPAPSTQANTPDYTVTAELCSNPIYALNKGYSMGYTVDLTSSPPLITGLADADNWIGNDAAIALLSNTCHNHGYSIGAEPGKLEDGNIYFACGNGAGMHFGFYSEDKDQYYCWFDTQTTTGHDVSMWLGFDVSQRKQCVMSDDGQGYQLGSSDSETKPPALICYEVSGAPGSLTILTGQDVAIMALIVVNLAAVIALLFICRARARGQVTQAKYEPVSIKSDAE